MLAHSCSRISPRNNLTLPYSSPLPSSSLFYFIMPKSPIRLAVFASGEGTNLENIIRYFRHHPRIEVALAVSNRSQARALQRAADFGVACAVIPRDELAENPQSVMERLAHIDYIILAGFLLRIPDYLTTAFPQRIINIHPSLLPKYGGKGMYGHHVHEAVCEAGEAETGITIHYVDTGIDSGETIAQFRVALRPGEETPESIAEKIHLLEQEHFPPVIERLLCAED